MSRPERPVRVFVRETAATPQAVARVRARLHGRAPAVEEIPELLRYLPEANEIGVARVRARLRRRRAPSLLLPLGLGLGAGGLLLAALAALAVRVVPPMLAPATLETALASEDAWRDLAPTPEVKLAFMGSGTLGGNAKAPVIGWEVGTVKVEVQPGRGIDLSVSTREAEVRVVGTGFDVSRDALGTTVHVEHGVVAVLCVAGEKALLGPGETRTCAPTAAAGLLGRARALAERGASAEDVLAAAEQGLAAGGSDLVRGELELVRIEALTRLSRADEALAASEAALTGAPARVADLHRLAAQNALAARGCAAALPHLAALVADDATGPELVQYADCVAPTEPAAARAALTSALRGGAPPDQEAAIVERLRRLPPESP